MTALSHPDLRLHASWARALLDFGSEQVHGSGSWEVPPEIRSSTSREACAYLVAELARRADPAIPPPPEKVRSDYFWITDADEVVGFIATRHDLNAFLLESGGHVGYSVCPSRRREGHARRALALALDHLAGLGLPRVLVTCDEGNVGSRRTIEGAGGVLEDVRARTMRFWIDLSEVDDPAITNAGGSAPARRRSPSGRPSRS
jgi:predicted acetyltransferase